MSLNRNQILSNVFNNKPDYTKVYSTNTHNKKQIDNLVEKIRALQSEISELSQKINSEAIETVNTINNKHNLSGKNIFFTNVPLINIAENLTPIGIAGPASYEQILGKNPTKSSPQTERGFNTTLYNLSNSLGNSQDTSHPTYIGIPVRTITIPTGPSLLNAVTNASRMSSFYDNPNVPSNNYKLFYYKENASPASLSVLNDFNLSYINLLPGNLMYSNFLAIGYNGYIYIGTGVEENELEKSKQEGENFLNYLIKNHNLTLDGAGKYIVNGTPNARCVPGTNLCGNLNTGTNYREQAKEDLIIADEEYSVGDSIGGSNPGLQSVFYNYGYSKIIDSGIADVENREHPLSGFPWFSLLSLDGNNIVGPDLNEWASERGGNISNPTKQAFLVGGLKSYTYRGCLKDYPPPNNIIENYVGNKSLDDCISYANKNTYNLIGMQFGEDVAPDNFTNGQCWVTKKTFNELEREKGFDCSSGMCYTNNCHGNPPIGSAFVNAIYKNNNAPMRLGAELYIQSFETSSTNYPPGSIIYKYPNGSNNNFVKKIIWKQPYTINRDILIPYNVNNATTKITNNFLTNTSSQYIFGKGRVGVSELYSDDMYFKLVLNSNITTPSELITGFMNSSNYKINEDAENNQITPLNKIFNYNTTGVKVNLRSDFSMYNIKSKNPNIKIVLDLLNSIDILANYSNKGIFTIIYKLNPLNINLLGRVGYINYDSSANSYTNKYKLSLYPPSTAPFENKESKFLNTKGTINKTILKSYYGNDNSDIINNINLHPTLTSETNCKRRCYNNLDQCQAWEFDQSGNNCWTYDSNQNDIQKLLKFQAPDTLYSKRASLDRLNIRVPEISSSTYCPNTIKDTLINGQTPTISNNIQNSNVSWSDFQSDIYWDSNINNTNNTMNSSSKCNVKKRINDDELTLTTKQDELLQLLHQLDSYTKSLETDKKNIYRKLTTAEQNTNDLTTKFENIKKKVDEENSNLDVQKTLDQSINDSLFNLINTNYNFIIWTVLAITIIVAGLHFSRNIKIKK